MALREKSGSLIGHYLSLALAALIFLLFWLKILVSPKLFLIYNQKYYIMPPRKINYKKLHGTCCYVIYYIMFALKLKI